MSAQHTGPLSVEKMGSEQFSIQNNAADIPIPWREAYVHFSGFFGAHGPHVFAAAPELLESCITALPAGVCLTNKNIPDDMTVPVDFTMGELRKIAAAIAKAEGSAA